MNFSKILYFHKSKFLVLFGISFYYIIFYSILSYKQIVKNVLIMNSNSTILLKIKDKIKKF